MCAVDDPWALVPTGLADPGLRVAAESLLSLAAGLLDAERQGAGAPLRAWTDRRRASGWAPADVDLQSLHHVEQEIP